MRIDLNPLAPVVTAPAQAVAPVAEITGRMALAMVAAELAANAGHAGTGQSHAQQQHRALSPPPLPALVHPSAAASAGHPLAAAVMTPSSTGDRLTLSGAATALLQAPPMAAAPLAAARPSPGFELAFRPTAPLAPRTPAAPTTAAATPAAEDFAAQPPARFLFRMLQQLTGEPDGQWHVLALRPGTAGPDAAYGPLALTAKTGAPLQLLLQGHLRTNDGQQVPFTFNAAVMRAQADDLPAVTLAAPWVRQQLVLDDPGVARDLAGQTLHFQMVLDPRNLWPLQSFLLSGQLVLGKPRPADPEAEEAWEWVWEEEPSPDDGLPKRRRKKLKPPKHDPVNERPEDGGPPIISGGRWLELELRHLRQELRTWMGLPDSAV